MPVGGNAAETFGQMTQRVHRRLMSNQREVYATLSEPYTIGQDTLYLQGPQVTKLQSGSIVAIEFEVFDVVTAVAGAGGTWTLTVAGGAQGSTNANHSETTESGFPMRAYLDPKFTHFDEAVAINDALDTLSSPTNGLFQVGRTTLVFNPVYAGYDLGAVPSNFTRILELSYDWPYPDRRFPLINRWEIRRGVTSYKFPSGQGIEILGGGYPGQPIMVAYGYPFTALTDWDDVVCTVSGLPITATDLPALLAEVFLMESREIKRAFIESQPDPRKAEDVPPGAMINSAALLIKRIQTRISEEADRLAVQWPRQRQGIRTGV